jgi:hypothetical protein
MKLGLVTYNMGKDMDCRQLIALCQEAGLEGVELRTTHPHGVEIELSAVGRAEVKKRFEDAGVEIAGLGSAFEYHSTDPAEVRRNIEGSKAYARLAADMGAPGIKVWPNGVPEGVPVEKTQEQIGLAVGIESLDDDNCISVGKHHNVGLPFPEAVRLANRLGIQVAALLMVGLPHDTPERLARTQQYLETIPCSVFDLRILRMYPGSSLYEQMLADGTVTEAWWLGEEPVASNYFLPGHLRVHFTHPHFTPMQLQSWTLKLTAELNRVNAGAVARVLRVGHRGGAAKFAATALAARSRTVKQARTLLARVEQAMATGPETPRAEAVLT